MDEFSLSGDSISISGRYVEILAEDWSEMDSTQRQSAAVKAYNQTISIRHHLHFKVFVAIFGVVCFMIAFQSIYYYDVPPIEGDAARTVGSSLVQGIHQLAITMTTFIALAIPLTANFYTPRLVDIFLKDKANLFFLISVGIFSSLSVFTDGFVFELDYVSWYPYTLITLSSVIGWALIIPYYYYVMRFLDPEVIVHKVSKLVIEEIDRIVKKKIELEEGRKRLNQIILQLGDIGFRSVDRKDSRTAICTIQALCFALDIYYEQKKLISNDFFRVEVNEFPNLSKGGLMWLSNSTLWVEEQILQQIYKIFTASIPSMPGVVSFIALTVREQCVPLMREEKDKTYLMLCIRFLNTFLRQSIQSQNIRAIFNISYQYITLAKNLSKFAPNLLSPTLRHFIFYYGLCRTKQLHFANHIISYDFGSLLAYLYRNNVKNTEKILDIFLQPKLEEAIHKFERKGIIGSRIILTSFLLYLNSVLQRSNQTAIDKIINSLISISDYELKEGINDVLTTTDEIYWEITDRVVNSDYVPPHQRNFVKKTNDLILLAQKRHWKLANKNNENNKNKESNNNINNNNNINRNSNSNINNNNIDNTTTNINLNNNINFNNIIPGDEGEDIPIYEDLNDEIDDHQNDSLDF